MVLPDPPADPSLTLGFTRDQGAAVALFPQKKVLGSQQSVSDSSAPSPGPWERLWWGIRLPNSHGTAWGFICNFGGLGRNSSPSCRDPGEVDLGCL